MRRPGFALTLLWGLSSCATPEPAPAPKPVPISAPASALADPNVLLEAIRDAYGKGDYAGGLDLVRRLVEATPDKVTAYDRIGSTYFTLGRQADALSMWETALTLEKDGTRRGELAASIALARRSLGLPPPPRVEPLPATRRTPPKPERPARPKKADAKEIERLFQEGVSKYAQSEYMAATSLFLRVLELNPTHEGAHKALERLKFQPTWRATP